MTSAILSINNQIDFIFEVIDSIIAVQNVVKFSNQKQLSKRLRSALKLNVQIDGRNHNSSIYYRKHRHYPQFYMCKCSLNNVVNIDSRDYD